MKTLTDLHCIAIPSFSGRQASDDVDADGLGENELNEKDVDVATGFFMLLFYCVLKLYVKEN